MALVPMRVASSSSHGILTVLLGANRSFEKNKINLACFSDSLMQVYHPGVCMFGCVTEANELIHSLVLIFLCDSYIPWKSALG